MVFDGASAVTCHHDTHTHGKEKKKIASCNHGIVGGATRKPQRTRHQRGRVGFRCDVVNDKSPGANPVRSEQNGKG